MDKDVPAFKEMCQKNLEVFDVEKEMILIWILQSFLLDFIRNCDMLCSAQDDL